ncbi:MAG TPA: hypothetical protein VMD02_07465 [Candidatus Omnitrophota bacterium]|nr:hypothetical protein [Candidatus Omnitrophota bacterium]
MDIILIANSPGELSALVAPVARKIKETVPNASVYLFLTPCQYVSGKETEFGKKNPDIDQVISAADYRRWVLGGKLPHIFDNKGVCLYLGGDLLHATLIAKKLKYPLYAYLSGKFVNWIGAFKKFFVPDLNAFNHFQNKGVPAEKLTISGDLMVDSVRSLPRGESRAKWKLDPNEPVVAFLPGSRKWEIEHVFPLYVKTGKFLKQAMPEARLMLIVSPFISMEELMAQKDHQVFDVYCSQDSVTAADLAVTIPGTNTAILAAQGMPMIVVFPLDKPEAIPLEGIMHYISSVPGLNFIIKRTIAWYANKTTRFFALPNIKSGQPVVEEIRGKIDTRKVAERAAGLLRNREKLEWEAIALKNVMGPPGAAGLIVKEITHEAVS